MFLRTQESYRHRFVGLPAALRYARRFEVGSRRRIDRRERRAIIRIFANLSSCASVLDVPCGAGRFLDLLSQEGRTVVAMDASPAMVDLARERTARLARQPTFLVGQAERTGLEAGAVDCVFCNRLLHHLSCVERADILREFWRVTRRYLVMSFFDYHSFGTVRRVLKAFKGRKLTYGEQPTLKAFANEVGLCGFQLEETVLTGSMWTSEKYLVLTRRDAR